MDLDYKLAKARSVLAEDRIGEAVAVGEADFYNKYMHAQGQPRMMVWSLKGTNHWEEVALPMKKDGMYLTYPEVLSRSTSMRKSPYEWLRDGGHVK